jgi:hypothetical protein
MKKVSSFVKLAAALLLFASIGHSQSIDSSIAYLPIQKGNCWIYDWYYPNYQYSYTVTVVGDTVMPNGLRYFMLERTNSPNGMPFNPYQRMDSITACVWAWNSPTASEVMLDSLAAHQGDRIFSSSILKVCGFVDTDTVLGVPTKVKTFSGAVGTPVYTYAYGIGVSAWAEDDLLTFGRKSILRCARINGKVYGMPLVDSALSFYPLSVCNTWQYKSADVERDMGTTTHVTVHYYTVNILSDTLMNNGKRYMHVQASDGSAAHPMYQRVDSLTAQVFAFDTSKGGKEYQIDNLRVALGTFFTGCRWSLLKKTEFWGVDSENPFGIPTMCRRYGTPNGGSEGTPFIYYVLAQNFGPTWISLAFNGFDMMGGNSTDDGLVYANIDGMVFGSLVSVPQEKNIPSKFVLYGNFPNPFNPTTTIQYELPMRTKVTLRVFNILGQQVALLADGQKEAGRYSVTWNASNVPSGVYFYRLEAGAFVQSRKMLLVK